MIGERIGEWRIQTEVARGAMGVVYRTSSEEHPGRCAALKVLTHPKALVGGEFERLFLTQIKLLASLQHPNIVTVYGGGVHSGRLYYCSEWLDSPDTATLLRSGTKFTWQQTLRAAMQLIPAIQFAHRRGILHRGIKPSNLFRTGTDPFTIKLADFAVTKFFDNTLLDAENDPLCRAAFISPEQLAGKTVTKRSDFYALGAVLYTLMAGRPPFTGATNSELIHKQNFILPDRPSHYVTDLPSEFERVIMRLLSKEPSQRHSSSTGLLQELQVIWSVYERRGELTERPQVPEDAEEVEEVPAEPGERHKIRKRVKKHREGHSNIFRFRTWFLIFPLLALMAVFLVWKFYLRPPTAEEYMAGAREVLSSDPENPENWEKAWDNYFLPMSQKYPNRAVVEVREAKQRVEDYRALNLAAKAAYKGYVTEAERCYYRGLHECEAGDIINAKKDWELLTKVFAEDQNEARWVWLAKNGLVKIADIDPIANRQAILRDNLHFVRQQIKELRKDGKEKEADKLQSDLLELYRNDPDLALLKEIFFIKN